MKIHRISNPAVKLAAASLILTLLLVACNRHNTSDAALQQSLVGTWRFSTNYPSNKQFNCVSTVASNGVYICQLTNSAASLPAHTLEGTWEVKDGLLIDTTTKLDHTNLPSPHVVRAHIIRFENDELGVQYEPTDFDGVLRKDTQ